MHMGAADGQQMKQSPALLSQAYHGSFPAFTLRWLATLRPKPELYSHAPMFSEGVNAAVKGEESPLTVTMVPNHSGTLHGAGA